MNKRKILFVIILIIVIKASYFYGLLSVKYELFPYTALKPYYSKANNQRLIKRKGRKKRKGRWTVARDDSRERKLTPEQEDSLSQILTLPYLQGYKTAPFKKSVTHYDEHSAFQGLNLFTSGHAPVAILMDMKGNILHEWNIQLVEVWPGPFAFRVNESHKHFWRRVHMFDNGDLLAIFEGIGLLKLDKDSKLLWSFKGRCHHDLYVAENKHIYVLTRKENSSYKGLNISGPILEDFITILSPDGKPIESFSLLECFANSDYALLLTQIKKPGDIFHTNTLELLEGHSPNQSSIFKRGNVLISIPRLNTIAVVNLEDKKVVWTLTGMWKAQHQPTLLETGNILLFDNKGNKGQSKVIEFNPLTQDIVWAYRGNLENEFISKLNGSNQRLPNGNTLITESDYGRAFEVAREGEIVWEFLNPYRAGKKKELIATIFEMIRIDPNQISAFWNNNTLQEK